MDELMAIAEKLNAAARRNRELGGDYYSLSTGAGNRIVVSVFLPFGGMPGFIEFIERELSITDWDAYGVAGTGDLGGVAVPWLGDIGYVVYDARKPFSEIGSMLGLADTPAHA